MRGIDPINTATSLWAKGPTVLRARYLVLQRAEQVSHLANQIPDQEMRRLLIHLDKIPEPDWRPGCVTGSGQ